MRQFLKKIAVACVGVATAASLLAPAADARPVVNQGDRVRLDMGLAYGICTVGYVDHARNQIAIARHCVKFLSLIHISEPTRPCGTSRMPSSA